MSIVIAEQTWPFPQPVFKPTYADEEGGDHAFAVGVEEFMEGTDGHLNGLLLHDVRTVTNGRNSRREKIDGTEKVVDCDLALISIGFAGAERAGLVEQLEMEVTDRGTLARTSTGQSTRNPKIFVCGDAGRGPSLTVWAIAEGRSCASAVDEWLMGQTRLPRPLEPITRGPFLQ